MFLSPAFISLFVSKKKKKKILYLVTSQKIPKDLENPYLDLGSRIQITDLVPRF